VVGAQAEEQVLDTVGPALLGPVREPASYPAELTLLVGALALHDELALGDDVHGVGEVPVGLGASTLGPRPEVHDPVARHRVDEVAHQRARTAVGLEGVGVVLPRHVVDADRSSLADVHRPSSRTGSTPAYRPSA